MFIICFLIDTGMMQMRRECRWKNWEEEWRIGEVPMQGFQIQRREYRWKNREVEW